MRWWEQWVNHEKKIAGCVNYFPISSFYWWKKEVIHDREFALIIQSSKNNFKEIEINEFPEKAKVFKKVTQAVCIYIFSNSQNAINLRTNLYKEEDLHKNTI